MAVLALVLLMCAGGPLAAFLFRWLASGNRYAAARWGIVGAFYFGFVVAIALGGLPDQSLPMVAGLLVCLLVVAGPFMTVWLLSVGPRAGEPSDRFEPRGFDVMLRPSERHGQRPDGDSTDRSQQGKTSDGGA